MEVGRQGQGSGGAGGGQGCQVINSSTHLVRVGAMSHSGFANCGWGREKQELARLLTYKAQPGRYGEKLSKPPAAPGVGRGVMGSWGRQADFTRASICPQGRQMVTIRPGPYHPGTQGPGLCPPRMAEASLHPPGFGCSLNGKARPFSSRSRMVSSPHRLVSSMKGGEQILSSGDGGGARVSTACSTGPLSTPARLIQQPTP